MRSLAGQQKIGLTLDFPCMSIFYVQGYAIKIEQFFKRCLSGTALTMHLGMKPHFRPNKLKENMLGFVL